MTKLPKPNIAVIQFHTLITQMLELGNLIEKQYFEAVLKLIEPLVIMAQKDLMADNKHSKDS